LFSLSSPVFTSKQIKNETTNPVDSLLQFVKSLNEDSLESLVRELEGKPKSFSLYYDRPEAHWEKLSKELTGLSASGSDIHTFLHKQEQGITD
jgi:hypothetical protein